MGFASIGVTATGYNYGYGALNVNSGNGTCFLVSMGELYGGTFPPYAWVYGAVRPAGATGTNNLVTNTFAYFPGPLSGNDTSSTAAQRVTSPTISAYTNYDFGCAVYTAAPGGQSGSCSVAVMCF
jgi:hypothetical protein